MGIKTISELDIAGRRLFIRVDFNVPLTPEGKVSDDTRIRESLPTIKLAIDKGARVLLAGGPREPEFAETPDVLRVEGHVRSVPVAPIRRARRPPDRP